MTVPKALRSLLTRYRRHGRRRAGASEVGRSVSLVALIEAARARDIPCVPWPRREMIQLGHGRYQRRLHAQRSDRTSALAQELAGSKEWTKAILRAQCVPVPDGRTISGLHQLPGAVWRCGFPLVIKPANGRQGRAVALDVRTWPEAVRAFLAARLRSRGVVVECYHPGDDYRLLVVGGRCVAAALRSPARVVGDGHATVRALIARLNADPRRGPGHENVLTRVSISRATRRVLRRQGHRLRTVLALGQVAIVGTTANLSKGGTARDVSAAIHPDWARLAERVAGLIGLDIAGVDVVCPDIARPLAESRGVIVEVNAGPGLRMHIAPDQGPTRAVATAIVDALFPPGAPARIPIVAVTGTNGKTTTTHLVAHLLRARGLCVGSCTTQGVYVDGRRLAKRDAAGPESARALLREPTVEAAAFEVARGGLLRAGLGFDACDVGILLNVAGDHLGVGGIETMEDLARVKGAVIEAVRPGGLAVLNADDPYARAQAARARGRVAYFACAPAGTLVQDHVARGGLAAVVDGECVVLLDGPTAHPLARVRDLPLAFGGRADFMVANALAASLAAFWLGMRAEEIGAALATFAASPAGNPGRMNLLAYGAIHVLVDYAHNPAAVRALAPFVRSWPGVRIAVVDMCGDRRDEDYLAFGELCARAFDRVIVREDRTPRGRPPAEVVATIVAGIRRAATACVGEIVPEEREAFRRALESAPEGALVVLLADDGEATAAELLRSPLARPVSLPLPAARTATG
jgi:cyanophycin synthetase